MDRKALIGLLSGISLVIATMIGVAAVNTPAAEGANSPAKVTPHECGNAAKASEPGYNLQPTNEGCVRAY